ncbi:MAG: carboxypeptidase regulatory-like domain-containing protein [Gammaproteobacteria bacterium]|nr:carboxypeptidase regulatory-like domain-containing protein [Gammaproteobacteria bacterium]
MDSSQRQAPEMGKRRAGYKNYNLILFLTLAVAAAGVIAYVSNNANTETVISSLGPVHPALTSGVQEDRATSKLLQKIDRSARGAPATHAVIDDPAAGITQQDFPVAAPQPGQTITQLCRTGVITDGLRCQSGRSWQVLNAALSVDDSDVPPGQSIAGRVLTMAGDRLSGITVIATADRLKDSRIADAGELRFRTMTDALGAYALEGLPEGEYTVLSSNHGAYRSARLSVRTGVTYADLVMSKDVATMIEGQVYTASGEPLEGVTVLPMVLGQPSVLTGYDGRFSLPLTLNPAVNNFELRFQRPGYVEQINEVSYRTPDDISGPLNIEMQLVESWTSLTGIVYSDTGDALSGLKVELRPNSSQRTYSAITNGKGQYEFPFIEAPSDYQLIVFGGDQHRDYQQALRLTTDTHEFDVVVDAYEFGEVTGQLVNLNGEPVPDFDLVLRNVASRQPNSLVSTDASGRFAISAAPAGELVIASQSTPAILVKGLQLKPGERLHVPLVLDWGSHEMRGLVVDARGNPVPASRIVLHWSHLSGGVMTRATRRTAADTQGHFVFSNLGPGPHSLQIEAPGFSTVDLDHDLSRQGYDITVRLN